MKRPDLLALDDDKLAALANRGLVKRARKDLAAGESFQLEVDAEGTLTVTRGEVVTRLPLGVPLAQTDCSCGARKACRHRVFAVLAYQEQGEADEVVAQDWDPGAFAEEELEALLGASLMRRARGLVNRGLQVQLRRGEPPTALLPTCTVSFLVPKALAYARCDCAQEAACEHLALAVWAFRAGQERSVDRVELGQGGGGGTGEDLLEQARELVLSLLDCGVVHGPAELAPGLESAARSLSRLGLVWMADLTGELAQSLSDYGSRAASYSSHHHASLIGEWLARERASLASGAELSPACVLGVGEPPETQLEHIRLTSLGARLWGDADSDHVDLYLADPDTSTVLVVSRRWARSETPLGRRNILKGIRLDSLARGQLVTKSARRRANRSLVIGRSRVAQPACYAQSGDWSQLFREPLLNREFAPLRQRLVEQGPALLRARVRAEQVVVLAVERIEGLHYDPARQQVRALAYDWQGESILLMSEFNPLAPTALESLYTALESGPRYLSGHLLFQAEGLTLEPLAAVTDRVLVPVFESTQAGVEMEKLALPPLEDAVAGTLERVGEVMARAAHQGLHYLPASWAQESRLVADQLAESGFGRLAQDLERLRNEPSAKTWAELAFRLWLTRECHLRDPATPPQGGD